MNPTTASANAEQRLIRARTIPFPRPSLFVVMIGLELGFLLSVLIWLLIATPLPTPLATAPDLTPLTREIQARLSGAVVDPLIEIKPGVTIHASNLRGFRYEGAVYYYYVEGQPNYDPLSRGIVRADQVEMMARDTSGDHVIVIYRLR